MPFAKTKFVFFLFCFQFFFLNDSWCEYLFHLLWNYFSGVGKDKYSHKFLILKFTTDIQIGVEDNSTALFTFLYLH